MSTTTNGRVKVVKQNAAGYFAIKVGDDWYSTGKKACSLSEGDIVEFDFYLKDEKWKTVKGDIRKLDAESPKAKEAAKSYGGREDYWTKKGERDITVVEPRITYLAAVERAIALASLCISNGTLGLEKAKQADKLGIILAFVDEQTLRIANAAMGVTVGATKPAPAPEPVVEDDPEKWD